MNIRAYFTDKVFLNTLKPPVQNYEFRNAPKLAGRLKTMPLSLKGKRETGRRRMDSVDKANPD